MTRHDTFVKLVLRILGLGKKVNDDDDDNFRIQKG